MKKIIKNIIFSLIIFFLIISLFQDFKFLNFNKKNIEYSTFISDLNKNQIKNTFFKDNKIEVIKKNNDNYYTFIPSNNYKLIDFLINKKVKVSGVNFKNGPNLFISILISWFPIFLLIGIWIFFIKQIQNESKNDLFFNKSNKNKLNKNKLIITFSDVAGCDEAKEEVMELVEYLKEPDRFKRLGGRIPKGILLVGPPGTGKTLLAKAIAGEAKVSFFAISGSEFVEMFVGVGASRVRDLFKKSKKKSPCIIFIDEIDAVGKKRGSNFGGGHDEREQTLNQMLIEMDGFESNEGVIVIAATNRPDVLDPALLRPGRFDRQVIVELPDIIGRKKILKIHVKKIPLSDDFNISLIAKSTSGFSGADLANLVNESALLAAKKKKKKVSMNEFELAKDRIIMGSERRSIIITESEKEYTAYHESGHVIISHLLPEHDPVHKVTIIPRGKSLGLTLFLPEKDNLSYSLCKLQSKISTLFGGRVAEEIIYGFNYISTGASNDIKVATYLARKMVTQWGFSKKLGPLFYSEKYEDNFLDSINKVKNFSDKTFQIIDKEIKLIIDFNYNRAKKILIKNLDILNSMKEALIKYETLNSLQINILMNRKKI